MDVLRQTDLLDVLRQTDLLDVLRQIDLLDVLRQNDLLDAVRETLNTPKDLCLSNLLLKSFISRLIIRKFTL